jgi:hypothetical protein
MELHEQWHARQMEQATPTWSHRRSHVLTGGQGAKWKGWQLVAHTDGRWSVHGGVLGDGEGHVLVTGTTVHQKAARKAAVRAVELLSHAGIGGAWYEPRESA